MCVEITYLDEHQNVVQARSKRPARRRNDMNAYPEPLVTIQIPATRGLHLLHAVLGQLQTSEVKVVVSDSNDIAASMPDFDSSQNSTAGGLRFTPIQGL
jgi:hypothetical protein